MTKQELNSSNIYRTSIDGMPFLYQRGNRYEFEDFHKLKNGGIYTLEAVATERQDLKRFTGDRWRRLRIAIDPLRHIESQKAVKVMQAGRF